MNIFHRAGASRRITRSFSISFRLTMMLCVCIALSAVAGRAQTSSSSRPVARLISSSSAVTGARARRATASPLVGAARTPAGSSATSLERRAFDLINAERRRSGEEPLAWDEELCRMARQHSEEMARQDFFGHEGPSGDTVERAHALGIRGWRALGENIAYNQGYDDPAAFVVQRWMGSAKHRANILSGMFTRSGLGIARAADGRIFFTQVFVAR
jgi:uncharacterized protein YkwD